MSEKNSPAPAKAPRNQAIDIFRGATIFIMVFFTVTALLSDQLPYYAAHNIPDAFHPGDLILPMFLFASGMSLVFFEKKRLKTPPEEFRKIILKRIALLFVVSVSLSHILLGHLLGMDEIMLNLLLFIPSLYLVRLSDKTVLAVSFAVILLHFGLFEAGMLPDYLKTGYLGGYYGAVWYLPVMLGGILCARNQERTKLFVYIFGAATIVMSYFCMPYKMNLYPTFIPLSIAWGFLFFELSKLIHSDILIYYGRTPLRYWVFQIALVMFPVRLYCSYNAVPHLSIDPGMTLLYGMLASIAAGLLSKAYDMHKSFLRYLGEREAAARRPAVGLTDQTAS